MTTRACPTCGYLPADSRERVVGECVPGRHALAMTEAAATARLAESAALSAKGREIAARLMAGVA